MAVCADCSSRHFDSFALVVAVAVAARASPRFCSSVCSSHSSLFLTSCTVCSKRCLPSFSCCCPSCCSWLLAVLALYAFHACLGCLGCLSSSISSFLPFLLSRVRPVRSVRLSTVRCLLSVRCRFSHISPIVYIWQVVHTQSRQRVRLSGCSRDVLSLPSSLSLSFSLALSTASAACS